MSGFAVTQIYSLKFDRSTYLVLFTVHVDYVFMIVMVLHFLTTKFTIYFPVQFFIALFTIFLLKTNASWYYLLLLSTGIAFTYFKFHILFRH